jgi:hypothetical protein
MTFVVEVEVYETGRGDLLLQAGERAHQRADLPRSPLQDLVHRRPVDPLEHERVLPQLDHARHAHTGGGGTGHQLRLALRPPAAAKHAAVAEIRDDGGVTLRQGTTLPGFMIPFGSKRSLMPR